MSSQAAGDRSAGPVPGGGQGIFNSGSADAARRAGGTGGRGVNTAGDAAGRDRPDSAARPRLQAPGAGKTRAPHPRPRHRRPHQPTGSQAGSIGRPGWRSGAGRDGPGGRPGLIALVAALAAIEGRLILLDHGDITSCCGSHRIRQPGPDAARVFVFRRSTATTAFLLPPGAGSGEPAQRRFGITMDARTVMRSATPRWPGWCRWAITPRRPTRWLRSTSALAALGYLGACWPGRPAGTRSGRWSLLRLMTACPDLTEPLGRCA